jgi:fructokinase
MHPEIGHMLMPDFDRDFDQHTNVCPFHSSCLEGRASGPAIAERWGQSAEELPPDHPAWQLEARYLAAAAVNLTAAWSPETIIIGGGVSQQEHLFPRIRAVFSEMAGGYWALPPLDTYIQPPAFGQDAGITSAIMLAASLLQKPVSLTP